jgi:hypothetical protein
MWKLTDSDEESLGHTSNFNLAQKFLLSAL